MPSTSMPSLSRRPRNHLTRRLLPRCNYTALLFPLLRGEAFRRPRVDRRNLHLERRIHHAMSCQRRFLLE
jgi:hypothetical protein